MEIEVGKTYRMTDEDEIVRITAIGPKITDYEVLKPFMAPTKGQMQTSYAKKILAPA